MRKWKEKVYYRIEFMLKSPLIMGSGKNEFTDKDIIRNGNGVPFIPGSALAGVIRSLYEKKAPQLAANYFGEVPGYKEAQKKPAKASRVIFYDANILKDDLDKYYVSKRDSVALDEYKTAKQGNKFDMEVLEPGIRFVTYLEQNLEENDVKLGDQIARAWLEGAFTLGAKTMRGYGEVGDAHIRRVTFDLTEKDAVEKWLDFDLYAGNAWPAKELSLNDLPRIPDQGRYVLDIKLKQAGGISIRTYSTKVSKEQNIEPDSEQLTVHYEKGKEYPTIPGTSWAGMFKSALERLIPGCTGDYFGEVDPGTGKKKKSVIHFSESMIYGSKEKVFSRNALDRFTGGTVDTALFTERTYYGGYTRLQITYDDKMLPVLQFALAAALEDLHRGFLAVGGLTAIGRGLFTIEEINGKTVGQESVYEMVLASLRSRKEDAQ